VQAEMSSSEESQTQERKRVILIRHAESENNVAKKDAAIAWRSLKTFSGLPTAKQMRSIGSMMSVPMNTDLSSDGERMAASLRHQMNLEGFIASLGISVVIHSHLIRARRTCEILFEHTGKVAAFDFTEHWVLCTCY
jgi:broad specificity phosphatase PhoE